jgi:hypothetical protein
MPFLPDGNDEKTLHVSHLQLLCDIVAGFIAWPLSLDSFTWLKYIDPIVPWDFKHFITAMNRARLTMGLPNNSLAADGMS